MKHRINRLPMHGQSNIRNEVFSVLAEYAIGGNHGPIHMQELFLKVVEQLWKKKIIKRPQAMGGDGLGGNSFLSFIGSRQPRLFPNYEMDPPIADLIRMTFWELYIQGVLAPATMVNPFFEDTNPKKHKDFWVYLDNVTITPYGVQVLSGYPDRIQVHDPQRYLDNFTSGGPTLDPEMMRYVEESVRVFEHGHFLAAVVLIGIASERLIEVLAERLRDALGDSRGGKFYSEYSKKRDISSRFKYLDDSLMGTYGDALGAENLKDPFQKIVTLTFETIRVARNDIAHPSGREFSWNEVSGFLHNFVQSYKYIEKIIRFLKNNPKTTESGGN